LINRDPASQVEKFLGRHESTLACCNADQIALSSKTRLAFVTAEFAVGQPE
jgi:hypothetical protein